MQYQPPAAGRRLLGQALVSMALLALGAALAWLLLGSSVTADLDTLGGQHWLLAAGASLALAAGLTLAVRLVLGRRLRYTLTATRWSSISGPASTRSRWEQSRRPATAGCQSCALAAARRRETLELTTEQVRYRLAVRDPAALAAALEQRQALGSSQQQAEGLTLRWPTWAAWRTTPIHRWALLGAVALMALGWALVAWRFQALPETIVLHFDPLGGTLGPRPRSAILFLPVVGLGLIPAHTALAALIFGDSPATSQLAMLLLALVELLLDAALLFLMLR